MICIIALIVSAILGVFSATHRKIAKEAFQCVFLKATGKPCNSALDKRLKADITHSIGKYSKKASKFTFKYFEVISWILLIITALSVLGVAWGGYNYYLYGNCNGPNSDGFCVFDPTGSNNEVSEGECIANPQDPSLLSLEGINKSAFVQLGSGQGEIVFIGCFGCEYTREAWPDIKPLIEESTFYFSHFSIKPYTKPLTAVLVCAHEEDPSNTVNLIDGLFETPTEVLHNESSWSDIITQAGYDAEIIDACAQTDYAKGAAKKMEDQAYYTGVYGTPLVFINEQAFVGPKPARVYRRALR